MASSVKATVFMDNIFCFNEAQQGKCEGLKSETLKTMIRVITPEDADVILEESKDYNYRTPNYATVDIYANDMLNGNWKENGESIKFDKLGKLIDGQHRIMAVKKSGVAQTFVIVLGIDAKVADSIDIGRKRSIEQYLKWQDKGFRKGATSIVQQVMVFDKGNKNVGQSYIDARTGQMDIMDEYMRDKEGYNSAADYGKTVNNQTKTLKAKEVGAIYYYLTNRMGTDKELVKKFFFNLYSTRRNENSIYATTMKHLEDKNYCKRSGVTRINEYILCWNAMLNGCTCNRVNYSDWFMSGKEAA